MKKLLTTATTLLLCSITITQLKIIPKVGINVSNFTQEDDIFESQGAFGFGAGIDARIGGRFYFAPGLYYLSSQSEIKKFNNITYDDVVKFSTIEIPLTIGFHIISTDNLKIGLKAGIEGAYFASIKEVAAIDQDDYQRLNWGFQFGAGMDIKRFTIDLKYDLGRNPVVKDNVADNFNPSYNKLHLYFGYIISKK